MPSARALIALTEFMDRLASLPRTGWLLRGVTDPESVAEHSFGVCVVAAMLVDDLRARGETLDGERVLRMATGRGARFNDGTGGRTRAARRQPDRAPKAPPSGAGTPRPRALPLRCCDT